MYGEILGDIICYTLSLDPSRKNIDFMLEPEQLLYASGCSTVYVAMADAFLGLDPGADDQKVREDLYSSIDWWYNSWDTIWGGIGDPDDEIQVCIAGWCFDTMERTRAVSRIVSGNQIDEAIASAIYMARTGKSKKKIKMYICKEFQLDFCRSCAELLCISERVDTYEQWRQSIITAAIAAFLEGDSFESVTRLALKTSSQEVVEIACSIAEAFYGMPEGLKKACKFRMTEPMVYVCDRVISIYGVRSKFQLFGEKDMYGAILGDIIGSPYEFRHCIKTKNFPLFSERSRFTDDTVMTIAVASALLKSGKDAELNTIRANVREEMQKWGRRYPQAGYGGAFRRWLAEENPQPYNSFGNGSAMRVSAAGWLYDSLERTVEVARATAEVTHNHPEGIKGAEAVAAAIYLARTGKSKEEIKAYIVKTFGYDLSRTCDEIRPTYFPRATCQETVPEAITAFLEGRDFEDVIRTAVSLGGDSDTLTAIAVSIAEAFYGMPEELEEECRKRIPSEMADYCEAVARNDFHIERQQVAYPENNFETLKCNVPIRIDSRIENHKRWQLFVNDYYWVLHIDGYYEFYYNPTYFLGKISEDQMPGRVISRISRACAYFDSRHIKKDRKMEPVVTNVNFSKIADEAVVGNHFCILGQHCLTANKMIYFNTDYESNGYSLYDADEKWLESTLNVAYSSLCMTKTHHHIKSIWELGCFRGIDTCGIRVKSFEEK
ncbi:MAG: ADP-ribosylglycohydrolase family protein [Eubacteriales bacterium]|nr:ADP-ribosylglycohydrolase family protein [Eubacteriales bacterium]